MKDRISASLLAQYVYCPRAAWYRAHGFTPRATVAEKPFKRGKGPIDGLASWKSLKVFGAVSGGLSFFSSLLEGPCFVCI